MANNYLQFSAELPLNSLEEKQWALRYLAELEHLREGNEHSDAIPDEFQCEVEDGAVWFYAEEYGNLDHVAQMVQQYLQRFGKPGDWWAVSYAETCGKMRLNEFGGGAVFVTADDMKFMNTYSWIQEQGRHG
jgi:hypothetical protein